MAAEVPSGVDILSRDPELRSKSREIERASGAYEAEPWSGNHSIIPRAGSVSTNSVSDLTIDVH